MSRSNHIDTVTAGVPDFAHVILTRFNVRTGFAEGRAPDAAWEGHRFDLLERYCFPSVKAQSRRNFRWMVFFDGSAAEKRMDRIDEYARRRTFCPRFVGGVDDMQRVLEETVRSWMSTGSRHLITTRLDSDEASHKRSVERIQRCFRRQTFGSINFPEGLVRHDGRKRRYHTYNDSSPFVSLIENAGGFVTVWGGPGCGEPAVCDRRESNPCGYRSSMAGISPTGFPTE